MLQATLQNCNPFLEWSERSRIGIFLCHSPPHTVSVPLVLSTQTCLVSLQFHYVFNDDFDTVKKEQHDTSLWKHKAHLQEKKDTVETVMTMSTLVTTPAPATVPHIPQYGVDIPAALQKLPEPCKASNNIMYFQKTMSPASYQMMDQTKCHKPKTFNHLNICKNQNQSTSFP